MKHPNLPKIISARRLQVLLDEEEVQLVDLSAPEDWQLHHIPKARHLASSVLNGGIMPAVGLLPPPDRLAQALSVLGLEHDKPIVAYDEDGSTAACRFLWTLDVIGFRNNHLLDGGISAWLASGGASTNSEPTHNTLNIDIRYDQDCIADKQYILDNLENPDVIILDTRSKAEYQGSDIRAARGGHIPGARHLNWLDTRDTRRGGVFKNDNALNEILGSLAITADKEVIVYCQTHQRSSHSYVMLKHLGFSRVKGYAGAWSEWGNEPDTPIEK